MGKWSKLFIVALFLLSSCKEAGRILGNDVLSRSLDQSSKDEMSLSVGENNCINPPETFAYKTKPETNSLSSDFEDVLPPPPWEPVLDISSMLEPDSNVSLIAVYFRGDSYEVWLRINDLRKKVDQQSYFAVYESQTEAWKTISSNIANSALIVGDLFVTNDGTVYGLTNRGETNGSVAEITLLAEYNEQEQKFEIVKEASIKFSETVGILEIELTKQNVLLTEDGVFWFFSSGDAIYSFDTHERLFRRHEDIDEINVKDVTIDSDGNIYFFHHIVGNLVEDSTLFRYSTKTDELENLQNELNLEPWPPYNSLLVDKNDRLWLGGVAWRERTGEVFQLLPSPIFISNMLWDAYQKRWKSPIVELESADGRIWFTAQDNGLVWLDPENEEWCWFTTFVSNIVEDNHHNLWLLVEDELFRNDF